MKKKLRLKNSIKEALVFGACCLVVVIYSICYTNRINAISNNANGYTESGHAHAVAVNFTR